MKKKDYIAPEDWKFMEQMPYGDPDFDPEHNRRVIAETEKWNDMMDRKRKRDYKEKTRERADAVAHYLKNVSEGNGVVGVEKYFGKRYLAYLRAEEIVNRLKASPEMVKKMKEEWGKKGKITSL